MAFDERNAKFYEAINENFLNTESHNSTRSIEGRRCQTLIYYNFLFEASPAYINNI